MTPCGFSLYCKHEAYTTRAVADAYALCGIRDVEHCPDCGIGKATSDKAVALYWRLRGNARETALITFGNLDAPL